MKFYVVGILSWTIVTMIQWILLLYIEIFLRKEKYFKEIFMMRMLMEMTIIVTIIIKIFHNIIC
jgi:hypothetical protein